MADRLSRLVKRLRNYPKFMNSSSEEMIKLFNKTKDTLKNQDLCKKCSSGDIVQRLLKLSKTVLLVERFMLGEPAVYRRSLTAILGLETTTK